MQEYQEKMIRRYVHYGAGHVANLTPEELEKRMFAMTGDAALDFFLTLISQHPQHITKLRQHAHNPVAAWHKWWCRWRGLRR